MVGVRDVSPIGRMTLAQIGPALQEILAFIKGAPALAQENADLKVAAAADKTRIAALESDLNASKDALTAKDGEISTAKAEADVKANEAADALTAKATAEAELTKLKDNPSLEALRIAAQAGVKIGERPPVTPADKQDKELKGLARVIAAMKAESASKK